MIDLHCHLLPGIDDGAQDVPEALVMAQMAVKEGLQTMVVTPHYYPGLATPSPKEIIMAAKYLQLKLNRSGIDLRLVVGQEVFFGLEIPEMVRQGQLLTIDNQGKYILLELPMLELPEAVEEVFFRLLTMGVTPIVAHPERNQVILTNPNLLSDWISKGILVQMNTGSLTGVYGQQVRDCARAMVEHDLVHFLGTDAHSCRSRAPRLNDALELLHSIGGQSLVQRLLVDNPSCVLAGKKLAVPPPSPIEMPETWLHRFKKLMKL